MDLSWMALLPSSDPCDQQSSSQSYLLEIADVLSNPSVPAAHTAGVACRRLQMTERGYAVPQVKRDDSETDGSIAGVLIFCGIGLALTVFAALFGWYDSSMPMF